MRRDIRTTVNLNSAVCEKLHGVARKNGVSTNRLVHILVMILRREPPLKILSFQQVRYQKRMEEGVWKRCHITFQPGAYEMCIDLRKLYKFSVSGLLSMGIEMFLDRAVDILKEGVVDNYPQNYLILVQNTSSPTSYVVFYYIPTENYLSFRLFPGISTA